MCFTLLTRIRVESRVMAAPSKRGVRLTPSTASTVPHAAQVFSHVRHTGWLDCQTHPQARLVYGITSLSGNGRWTPTMTPTIAAIGTLKNRTLTYAHYIR